MVSTQRSQFRWLAAAKSPFAHGKWIDRTVANIPAFENIAALHQLPPTGAYIVALPMKIKDGSGGPLRIAAWLAD